MSRPDPEVWVGFMWVIGIVGCNITMSTALNAASHHITISFTRMTTALPILIYDKVLTHLTTA